MNPEGRAGDRRHAAEAARVNPPTRHGDSTDLSTALVPHSCLILEPVARTRYVSEIQP